MRFRLTLLLALLCGFTQQACVMHGADQTADPRIRKLEQDGRRKDQRPAFAAIAVKAKDGDSLFVKAEGADKEEQLRLFGVDAPELDQLHAGEARSFMKDAVVGKEVTVVPFYQDKLGRTIAVVICEDGEPLENKLVKNGLAWWYKRYDKDNEELAALEKEARSKRAGLWADPNPVNPEKHRRKQFDSGAWKVIDGKLHMTKDGRLVPEDDL